MHPHLGHNPLGFHHNLNPTCECCGFKIVNILTIDRGNGIGRTLCDNCLPLEDKASSKNRVVRLNPMLEINRQKEVGEILKGK